MKRFTFRSVLEAAEDRGWQLKRIFPPYRYFECDDDPNLGPTMFEVEVITIEEGPDAGLEVGLVREDVAQKACDAMGLDPSSLVEWP